MTIILLFVCAFLLIAYLRESAITKRQNREITSLWSIIDQWQAYTWNLESDVTDLQNSLYEYHAKYGNGNRDQLPLVINKATLPIVDRYTTRGGVEIVEEKPKKTTDHTALIDKIEKSIGGKLESHEVSRVIAWESGKGKSDSAEYAKRIKGIRKSQK